MAHKFISRSKKRDSHLCAIHPLISSSYLTAHHHHHHLSWHIYSLTLSRVYYTHLLYCEREWGRKKTFLATSTSEFVRVKEKERNFIWRAKRKKEISLTIDVQECRGTFKSERKKNDLFTGWFTMFYCFLCVLHTKNYFYQKILRKKEWKTFPYCCRRRHLLSGSKMGRKWKEKIP